MRFILGLKGSQFASALIKVFPLALQFWQCAARPAARGVNYCQVAGPGVNDVSVSATILMLIWLQLLTWYAFLLLPYASKLDPVTGTIIREEPFEVLWNRNRRSADAAVADEPRAAPPARFFSSAGGKVSAVLSRGEQIVRRGAALVTRSAANPARVSVAASGKEQAYAKLADDMEQGLQAGIRITAVSAAGLKAADYNGFSDPYATLTLCGAKHKTKTVRRSLSPTWEQSFLWAGDRPSLLEGTLEVVVMDWDRLTRDDLLGSASVPMASLGGLGTGSSEEREVALDMQGSVLLRFEWIAGASEAPTAGAPSPGEDDVVEVALVSGTDNSGCCARLTNLLPWITDEATANLRALTAAIWQSTRGSNNRMILLLLWDSVSFAACALLFVSMIALALENEWELEREMGQTPGPLSPGSGDRWSGANIKVTAANPSTMQFVESILWVLWAGGTVLSGRAWETWQAKMTFQICKLLFAFSAFPFFVFNTPLGRLFSHADATAYTSWGQLTFPDPAGLGAFLHWIKHDIISSSSYHATEFKERFDMLERAKLRLAVKDAERHLAQAWKRPALVRKVSAKEKRKLEALLASIVTKKTASAELYQACFPDQVVLERYKRDLEEDG